MKETAEGFGLLCIIGEQNIARSNLILKSGSLGNVVQGKTGSGVCGSCGQDDGCKSWVNKPQTGKAAARIYSRCPLAPIADGDQGSVASITLNTAKKYTTNNPCTNVPIDVVHIL